MCCTLVDQSLFHKILHMRCILETVEKKYPLFIIFNIDQVTYRGNPNKKNVQILEVRLSKTSGSFSGHQIVSPVEPVGHLHLWSDSEGLTAGPNVR